MGVKEGRDAPTGIYGGRFVERDRSETQKRGSLTPRYSLLFMKE
jgi:hypothetical protein